MKQKRALVIFAAAVVLSFSGGTAAQEPTPQEAPAKEAESECKIPEDAAKVENPVKAQGSSIRQGQHLFETQCALCHGKTGDGKGDLVEPMGLKMKDYRDPAALEDLSDGALFFVLEKGCGKMPGEEGRMKANQMWNLVNFIRSLARKQSAEKQEAPK